MRFHDVRVTLELTEYLLGTVPEDFATWDTWIRPTAPGPDAAAQEAAAHPRSPARTRVDPAHTDVASAKARARADAKGRARRDEEEDEETPARPRTTFFVDGDAPVLFNYHILGHLRETANIAKGGLGVRNLREKVNRYVYVTPRLIPLRVPIAGVLERPLRAQTAQGARVTLATSDVIAPGAQLVFTVRVLDQGAKPEVTLDLIRELFSLGEIRGLGQWRSGGWGTYSLRGWDPQDP
jgi:hypothetical protein